MKPDLKRIKELLDKNVSREDIDKQLGYNSKNSLSKAICNHNLLPKKSFVGKKKAADKSNTTPQRLGVLRNQWKKAIESETTAGKKAAITKKFQNDCGVNFAKEAKQNESEAKLAIRKEKQAEKKKAKKEKPIPFKPQVYIPIFQQYRNRIDELEKENKELKRKKV